MTRLFALTFSLAFTVATLLTKCGTSTQSQTTKAFNFADNYLAVKRTIEKIDENKYKIVVEIKSPIQLEGYVTIDDSFPNPIQSVDSSQWKYAAYFSSDKEIRFNFSDPATTIGDPIPIPDYKSFKVDYIVKVKDTGKLEIHGVIRYLVRKKIGLVAVPELVTSIEF